MGYNTSIDGELTISPPLTWAEFKDSQFHHDGYDPDVKLRVDEQVVNTDEGQLIRKTASALIASSDEALKFYDLLKHVQQAIDSFPGHTFAGRLECEGEDTGDLWRVVVRAGRAVKVVPEIVWPDDAS